MCSQVVRCLPEENLIHFQSVFKNMLNFNSADTKSFKKNIFLNCFKRLFFFFREEVIFTVWTHISLVQGHYHSKIRSNVSKPIHMSWIHSSFSHYSKNFKKSISLRNTWILIISCKFHSWEAVETALMNILKCEMDDMLLLMATKFFTMTVKKIKSSWTNRWAVDLEISFYRKPFLLSP